MLVDRLVKTAVLLIAAFNLLLDSFIYGGNRPIRLNVRRSSRENADPLFSSGVSSREGPAYEI